MLFLGGRIGMVKFEKQNFIINFSIRSLSYDIRSFFERFTIVFLLFFLIGVSICSFIYFYLNGLGLAYNDARSHLDIGRRVVEGLKPGLAQLGSVWLPLPHILMIPTVWNDFMWHSGFSGSIQSMVSFVITSIVIYLILQVIGVGMFGRLLGVIVFATNLNILYLQSTAMTELLLIATMTIGIYYILLWFKTENILNLIISAFCIMLSTLVRYDGWFLFAFSNLLITIQILRKKGYKVAEGIVILFATMAGFGIFLWFLWNQLIFKDALYFMYGPYSAHAQQQQLQEAGVLATKGDFLMATRVYLHAIVFNSNAFIVFLALIGAIVLWISRGVSLSIKIALLTLLAPLLFNILALYLGHSVLFIEGISGDTWFNARYGVMMMPSFAIFIGYLVNKFKDLRFVIVGLLSLLLFFSFVNADAVTIDDAKVGSSQKNVSEVSGWLRKNANKDGFILISVASHDAIIFSSGFPMIKFIHEGTGAYWESATTSPDRWARWIIMRTNDTNDLTFKLINKTKSFRKGDYKLVNHYPFADIYEIKPSLVSNLNTKPIIKNNK